MRKHLVFALALVLIACGGSDARPLVKTSRNAGCGANKTLTLSWSLPTTYADGTAIGVITGQNVYYDTTQRQGVPSAYANSVSVGDGTSTSYQIACLAASTTYYVSHTVIVGGVESNYAVEESATTAP
jgi:hypothetical protein